MAKNVIKEILYITIAIILSILAVKFVIWLLPIVLIVLAFLLIYNKIKIRSNINNKNENYKYKNIKVIHDDEKDN